MDKLLEKYHDVEAGLNISAGLLAAQSICARKLLEVETNGEREMVLSIMQDILTLMAKTGNELNRKYV